MISATQLRRRPRAGRHADDWFWATYRPWRRRARLVFAMIACGLAAAIMGLALLLVPAWWQFYAGCTFGLLAAMYLCLIDAPPEWIDRKRRGRDGERRTELRLRRLEQRGWRIAHDIDNGRGNIDHVVAGPPGVYLLDTKNLSGEASVRDGMLTIARGDDDRDSWTSDSVGNAVKRSAIELRDELRPATGVRWVQGVVVLWCDFPDGYVESESVVYLHGDRLHDWLYHQRPALDHDAVERLGDRLDRLEQDGLQVRATVVELAGRRSAR